MLKRICFILALSALSLNVAMASDVLGKDKSLLCTWCHGYSGISANPIIPNLAGQNKEYLKKALTDLREKRRENRLMNAVASGLSDQDIDELADYFSKMEPMRGSNND